MRGMRTLRLLIFKKKRGTKRMAKSADEIMNELVDFLLNCNLFDSVDFDACHRVCDKCALFHLICDSLHSLDEVSR